MGVIKIKEQIESIISAFIIINAVISVTIIILERKQPEKTISWLLIFILFPLVGLILYLFLGRNWKIHKLNEGFSPEIQQLINNAKTKFNCEEYTSLIELLANNNDSPLFISNDINIFMDGTEKFQCLKEELLKAKHHIHLEYYIVKDDDIGNEIKDILIQKALSGVKVRFIMDRVGCIRLKKNYIKELKNAGIDVIQYSYFLAPILKHINTQINYRNHRKIVVIDGIVGFIGGINIGDEYLGKSKFGYWRDTHLMIKGDFVLGLQATFFDDFITIKRANKETFFYDNDLNDYFIPKETIQKKVMQLVKSGPDSKFPAIQQSILKMITLARDHIYITTPYFIPSISILDSLKVASLSGIDVRILFPGKHDHIMVYYASRTYLAELLKCGVNIYFYNSNSFVHSKTMTIDGKICTVGTANMDIRSYELNYEINSVIYDMEITEKIENRFFEDLKESNKITIENYDNISPFVKAFEAVARIFSSLL
jgi:Phosphatidylserine/phosphatidylglycerophosphate/cardiolipin synthases and related enzymes